MKEDMKKKKKREKDELLIFLAARLVNVYGESVYTDYILKAERLSKMLVDTSWKVSR